MVVEHEKRNRALLAYRPMLDGLPLPATLLDPAGRVQGWNRAAELTFGWSAGDVLRRPPPGIPEEEQSAFMEQLQRALHGETVLGLEGRRLTKGGSVLRVRLAAGPLYDEEGEIVGALRTFEDITARTEVEEALRQSEERYRTIVQTANEGIWLIDLQARTLYANERMAAMLGYTRDELVGLTVLDCLFPGDEPLARERIGKNLQGITEQFDFRFRRKDGSELLVLACTSPVRGGQSQITGALGMFTDISARVRAEQERSESLAREQQARLEAEEAQQRLTFLADAGAILASSLDYETTLTNVARLAVERIADWCAIHLVDDKGEARQITVVHPDPARIELAHELERRLPYDPEADSGVPQVLRTGVPELIPELTDEMLDAAPIDGEVRAIFREIGLRSWIIAPLSARGHILGAITFVAAESDRRYGAEDLALAMELAGRAGLAVDNARLHTEAQRVAAERSAILAQMADGVAIADAAGRIIFVNEAGRKITGSHHPVLPLDDALALYHVTTDQGEPFAAEETPLFRALQNRETVSEAYWKLRLADGTERIIQGNAAPLVGENGEVLGAVSTYRDVTAQHTLEQQRDQFLAAAAHDLKTPLTTIRGVAQILRRRLARGTVDPNQFEDGLSRIEQTTTRMTSLINELLDLTRLQMGQSLELNRRSSDLFALIARCVAEQEEMAGDRRIRIETTLSELAGVWDADRLDRVISNLLSNAIKYSPDGSEITIKIDREDTESGAWVTISVQDHGIGIPPGDLPHIFERFHRGQNVGDVVGGTGIGLAASKQIVEQHQGTITVQSQEGIGSTFTVRLPISE